MNTLTPRHITVLGEQIISIKVDQTNIETQIKLLRKQNDSLIRRVELLERQLNNE